MKSKLLSSLLLASGIFAASMNANALVITGQIEQYSSPSDSYFQDVDFYTFSSTGGTFTVDVLEWGFGGNDMDSMIWLFNDDGSLDTGDLLTENDDSGSTFGDGSTTGLDSWLSTSIGAGSYIFAIGECCNYGANDIVDGIQSGVPGDLIGATITQTFDYQLTITGAVSKFQLQRSAVPEPATLALLSLGLAGIGFSRKKKTS